MFMMMAWMPLLVLFWIVVAAVVIWLIIRWLNQRQRPTYPSMPPQQRSFQSYEQGYQPPQQASGTYQEGGMSHTYEEPQAQYPRQEEPPPQQ